MVSKMISPSKSSMTYVAGKWSFVRMGPFVDQKIIGFGELSLAKSADEFFLFSWALRFWDPGKFLGNL